MGSSKSVIGLGNNSKTSVDGQNFFFIKHMKAK
jgi:hypothetical protein